MPGVFSSASETSVGHPVITFLLGYVSSCTFIFLNLSSKINSLSPLIIFIDLPWIFSRMMAPVCSWNPGAVYPTYCHHPHSGSAGIRKQAAWSMPDDFRRRQHLFSPVCETQPNNLRPNHLGIFCWFHYRHSIHRIKCLGLWPNK